MGVNIDLHIPVNKFMYNLTGSVQIALSAPFGFHSNLPPPIVQQFIAAKSVSRYSKSILLPTNIM